MCDCLDCEQDLPLTLYIVGLLERLAEPLKGPVEHLDSEVFWHRVHTRQDANDGVQVSNVSDIEHIRADLAALAVLDHLGQLLGDCLRMLRKIANIEAIVLVDELAEGEDCVRGDGLRRMADALA